ncbi:MAG: heavy metal translocating P-type ATPase [Rhodobiaceae bacterium]|nr:heavy metal translocating P-type ATPase [Rhodobiaceae bacterium]MCC0050225.1 heavy metal translocating P-type ATPase [Rhodobiaceae bacterium]
MVDGNTAHIDLAVEGLRCAGCMAKLERGINALDGVSKARVNLTSKRMAVEWSGNNQTPASIINAVTGLGFKAYPFDPGRLEAAADAEGRSLLRALAVAGFAAANIMLLSVSVWSGNVTDITPETRDLFHMISALIALPAVAYSGQTFFGSALAALRAKSLNMDVPISLGVLLAVGMSLFQTFNHAHHAYFDSAVMLLFFLLIGRYLDHTMRRRTRDFAANLSALRAETATKLLANGEAKALPVSAIDPGDLVLVKPGERLAVDGIVETGVSEIDQSLVTGETVFARAEPGTAVYAGTLNQGGVLHVRVTAAGGGTLLDDVNRLLEKAFAVKNRYVALADRAARVYAPVVHTLSALTFIGWLALGAGWETSLITAIAVLIITCPCALGLAVPAVQVVATGRLFKAGILLNGGDALERLAGVDTIIFDKTGTLTLPDAVIADEQVVDSATLALAARLAVSSSHPLANALAAAYPDARPVEGAREEAGKGVAATLDGAELKLGSAALCGVGDKQRDAAQKAAGFASLIWFAREGADAVPIRIGQALRHDAAETVHALQAKGYAIEILSGDRQDIVDGVAADLGIASARGGLSPADKIARIEALKEEGHRVLMLGDGLNDAPALAAADVSMSPVTAVHLSQAAADAVFLGERLAPVVTALTVSKRARAIMGQNLWLAVIYNMVAVPVAIAGLVTPLIAALAMSGSSILVTTNALRARFAGGKA